MDVLPFSLLGFGFLLGVKHAFEADHIAAVSTIVSKYKSIKKSSLAGALWGFGHTISLLSVGLAVLLLKIKIPEKIALSFEFIAGVMLVILGFNVLITINKNRVHLHKHKHGKEQHIHLHSHKLTKQHQHEHLSLNKSLFIGLVHGLAGSAALTLLVLAAINSVLLGLFYMLIFSIGTVIGMAFISSIIALPFALMSGKLEKTQTFLRISAGFISTILGFILIYDIGFVKGLI